MVDAVESMDIMKKMAEFDRQYTNNPMFRDWSKRMGGGGGGVGRSREGVGHEVLSLVQGVGRAIFSYPQGVGHPIFY